MKKRIVVAMSGGVDSSVAAALLKEEGYEVIGMTMCFNLADSMRKRPACCGVQGIEDARRVAHKLGIKHYVLNMQKLLEEKVIKDFSKEYALGRTPNPCIRCNQYLKFDILLKKALALDANFLTTGHYARIVVSRQSSVVSKKYLLKKAKDKNKDQSYFLYRLNQGQLKHILFPLGNYTKDEVRILARKFALPVAEKLASQEICFLPDENYRQFLKNRIRIRPGEIVNKEGNLLGAHKGIACYTIGQRSGLGIAKGYPIYITKINPKNNQITVGRKEEALKKEFLVKAAHFIANTIKKKVALKVKIRYNHKETLAEVLPLGDKLKVKFKEPQFAITPGQAAVFYDKDTVVGGGIIDV
ncbi:MAG TPA: tRNA 2-thiouridine(34) synthase MnmA [Candidatus Omnitrophota bacterium]|nr:tRNA 2-thiouridine(34) synthase MnmA [Candidatus Omnitrophota bacterium]